MSDAALARSIAEEAGVLLLKLRGAGASGADGDHQANALILDHLVRERPGDAFLSEEAVCDGARLGQSRVWIVDPLDGTREFAEGREDWAVHVALAVDGVAATGAVALPAQGLVLSSDRPQPLAAANRPLVMVVSRTRPAAEALTVARALGAELLPMGSAGAKAMAVVRGTADIYLHTGGQNQWDNAAPVAVAAAHGLHCSRVDGAPLVYNLESPSIPDLLICRPELARAVLAAL